MEIFVEKGISPEMEHAITILVAHGCVVRVPVPMGGYLSNDDLDRIDGHWEPRGVRVHLDMKSGYFSRRIQEIRRRHGMPYNSAYSDHLVFEREPKVEMAHGN